MRAQILHLLEPGLIRRSGDRQSDEFSLSHVDQRNASQMQQAAGIAAALSLTAPDFAQATVAGIASVCERYWQRINHVFVGRVGHRGRSAARAHAKSIAKHGTAAS